MSYLTIPPRTETAGSAAYSRFYNSPACDPNCPPNCSNCGTVNFGAKNDEVILSNKKGKKGGKAFWATAGILATGAAAIIGLAYTHKLGWVNKLGKGKFKNFAENVTEKCHDWCHWTKGEGLRLFAKTKNFAGSATDTCHNWYHSAKEKGLNLVDNVKNFFKGKAN